MGISARLSVCLLLLIVVTLCGSDVVRAAEEQDKPSSYLVYVGTYTQGRSKGKGIYRFRLDMASGALKPVGAPTEAVNPSFLALHPSGKFLYAVNETGAWEGRKNSGAVSAYAINAKTGDLTFLNRRLSRGGAPCHLSVDATGRSVHVANYSGGSVISFPIGSDGRLGAEASFFQHEGSSVTPRQKGPHAHCINLDAGNKFAFVADLGLDKVMIYRLDANSGKLTANTPAFAKLAPGSGPRHFAIHPDQKHAYVINEIASTVTVFNYDADRWKRRRRSRRCRRASREVRRRRKCSCIPRASFCTARIADTTASSRIGSIPQAAS